MERVEIDDIESGDIIWIDKDHGYCSVLDVHLGLRNGYIVGLEDTGLCGYGNAGKTFSKWYSKRKTFKLYE